MSLSIFLNKPFEVWANRWSSHTYLPTSWDEKASTVLSRSCDSVHWSLSPTSTVFPVPASLTRTFIVASHRFVFYHSLTGLSRWPHVCVLSSITAWHMYCHDDLTLILAAHGITGVTQKAAQWHQILLFSIILQENLFFYSISLIRTPT